MTVPVGEDRGFRRHEQRRLISILQQLDRLMRRHGIPHGRIGRLPASLEFLESQFFDNELHAGLVAILAVPERIEHLDHRFDRGKQFVHRRKFSEHLSHARGRSQSTARDHSKPYCSVCPFRREQPDVVDRRKRAILPASRQGDLEFPRKALVEGVPQEMQGHRLRIRRHIEDFPLTHAGKMTSRDIPHGIGAGFTGRQPTEARRRIISGHV